MQGPDTVSLLRRIDEGDADAAQELLPIVYGELRRLASRAMAKQGPGHTLQTTALLNEAWLRLVDRSGKSWENRDHFLAVAATAMRSVLVDHARRRGSGKRAVGARVDLDDAVAAFEHRSTDLLALDVALDELAARDAQLARIVEMRFFGGLKHSELARVLDLPLRTVERRWKAARSWLFSRLAPENEGGSSHGQ
ncbi:MAG: sigma-70 family RNA polymerase sigma factor [bacterium]|nr:sigma-70 family RNA polymerase sigma factor [bacterium]